MVANEKNLKRCPFCESKAEFLIKVDEEDHNKFYYDIRCTNTNCYLAFGADWFLTEEEVLRMWNTRI